MNRLVDGGSTGSITLDVYSKSGWDERVDAVTRVVEPVLTEPEEKKENGEGESAPKPLRNGANDLWVPFWVPHGSPEFAYPDLHLPSYCG